MADTPQTIGDVIAAELADQASKGAAAAQADDALAAANTALLEANAALASDLAALGPVFTVDSSGNVLVYFPDASAQGYHVIQPLAATTPLPPPVQSVTG
jgi:hypothetical protein